MDMILLSAEGAWAFGLSMFFFMFLMFLFVAMLAVWLFSIYWVYKDSERRGMDDTEQAIFVISTAVSPFLTPLAWIAVLIAYVVVRPDS